MQRLTFEQKDVKIGGQRKWRVGGKTESRNSEAQRDGERS